MVEYNEEYDAYAVEFDDAVICWDDEPEDDCRQIAETVRNAYFRNLSHIAEAIFDEIKDMPDVKDKDDVIAKLGKPLIYPDNGQVTFCECEFDDAHIISFEYLDDEFDEIQYVSIDG